MKRILIILLTIITIAGCKSLPTPDNGQGTLVVFPVVHIKGDSDSEINKYNKLILKIYDYDRDEFVMEIDIPERKEYTFTNKLPPGKYYVAYVEVYSKEHKATYNGFEYTVDGMTFCEIKIDKELCYFNVYKGELVIVDESFGLISKEPEGSPDNLTYFGLFNVPSNHIFDNEKYLEYHRTRNSASVNADYKRYHTNDYIEEDDFEEKIYKMLLEDYPDEIMLWEYNS